jgi:hypothetical protein
MVRLGIGTSLFVTLALGLLSPKTASAQGQAVEKIKVNLPAPPNFDVTTAPPQYPSGELSIYGLRKGMSKYLDKDVRVKAYLLEIYECPAEIRKCNDEAAAKAKREKRSAKAQAAAAAAPAEKPACRPCDQPHFFLADTKDAKIERALLVADYPVKDWKTNKPKPLVATKGEQYIVTGTFAINSITGFAASNGLIIHKRFEDQAGKVLAEGNAVLPPEAQTIQLDGKPPMPVGAGAVPPKK